MLYVNETYYNEIFKGESVDTADFPDLCARAEEIIEELTMYNLTLPAFNDMSEDIQEQIREAVCAQIEYLDANGGSEMDNGTGLQSASLGKFSYTQASGADGSAQQPIYAPRAMRILAPTGLLYRGGGCY